jgi:hypothetical protein
MTNPKNQQTPKKTQEPIRLGPDGIPLNRSVAEIINAAEKRLRPKSFNLRRKAKPR